MDLPARIKQLREERGLTQIELAKILKISNTTLSQYETGARVPSDDIKTALADYFGVSLDFLFGRANYNQPDVENIYLSSVLKDRRIELGLTLKDVADYVGVSEATVSRWESGSISDIKRSRINKLAEVLQISPLSLIGISPSDSLSSSRGVKIPVLGNVAAGLPIEAVENIVDYEEIDQAMAASGEHFGLRLKGDSMEPRMKDGDVVIVRKQEDVKSGDIAVVLVNGDSATVKRIKKGPSGITLIPNNPVYDPMFYSSDDIEQLPVRILGKVVELRGKL